MKSLCWLLIILSFVSCRPPQEAADYDQLEPSIVGPTVPSDDSSSKELTRSAEESFIQPNQSQLQNVDIVWVIDNSGSMEEEQEGLIENFDSFIDNFFSNGQVDFPFKMGVTTTEAYRGNNDKWENYDLSSEAATDDLVKFKDDFKSAVDVGLNGSGREKALRSAYTMTQSDPSFFGGDESLSVFILVTDEQEQSHVAGDADDPLDASPYLDENDEQYTIAKWIQKFQALKSDPKQTLFFPIVRTSVIDMGNYIEGDVDNRFLELANLSGTKRSDIDQPFDSVLSEISQAIKSTVFRKNYLIQNQNRIVDSSVRVYIDDQEQIGNWDLSGKMILFDAAPSAGSEVKIKYQYIK